MRNEGSAARGAQTDRRKRVLVAVGNYPPGYGGAGLRVHRTYKRLERSLAIETHAVTISGRGDMANCSAYDGVSIFQTRPDSSFAVQFIDVGRFLLRQGISSFDLVHALGQSSVATAASCWGMILRVPVIRELTVNQPISRSLKPLAVIRRLGFQRAALVIALNKSLKERLLVAGVDPARIWERPNPMDLRVFHLPSAPERSAARQLYGLRDGDIVHLILGRLCDRKNQLFALSVLERLGPRDRLMILGPELRGDADYVAEIRNRIARRGLGKKVIFRPGYVKAPAIAYHASDCCWIPSKLEGMPNVLLEALACGLPVISNQALELGDHIAEGVNGYTADLEPNAFAVSAAKAAATLSGPAAREQIAAGAASRYGSEPIDQEFARQLTEILEN